MSYLNSVWIRCIRFARRLRERPARRERRLGEGACAAGRRDDARRRQRHLELGARLGIGARAHPVARRLPAACVVGRRLARDVDDERGGHGQARVPRVDREVGRRVAEPVDAIAPQRRLGRDRRAPRRARSGRASRAAGGAARGATSRRRRCTCIRSGGGRGSSCWETPHPTLPLAGRGRTRRLFPITTTAPGRRGSGRSSRGEVAARERVRQLLHVRDQAGAQIAEGRARIALGARRRRRRPEGGRRTAPRTRSAPRGCAAPASDHAAARRCARPARRAGTGSSAGSPRRRPAVSTTGAACSVAR